MFKKRFVALTSAAVLGLGLLAGCTGGGKKDNAFDSKKTGENSVLLTPQWEGVIDANEKGADFDSFFK